MFKADGEPLGIQDLDDETAAVVAGLDVLEETHGSGKERRVVGSIKKWKLADKKGALDMLMKHLGGYKVDNEQGSSGNVLADFMTNLAERGSRLPTKGGK
jgi:phage terminase small subunit